MLIIGMFAYGLGIACLASALVVNHRWTQRAWQGLGFIMAGSLCCYMAAITYPW